MNYISKIKKQNQLYIELLKLFSLKSFNQDHWIQNYQEYKYLDKQGVKIHLSANINNTITVAKKFLQYNYSNEKKLDFKIVADLYKLGNQNAGLLGYSQIGKLITIYPKNNKELLDTLNDLEIIYKSDLSPEIPSDFRYMLSSVVHYRYGEIVIDPHFNDLRNKTIPENIKIPIPDYYISRINKIPKHLILLKVLKKTGKGGIYQCFNVNKKELVLLKQGVNQADLTVNNVDTINLLAMEKRSLLELESETYFPKFIDDFYLDNSYFLEISYLPKQTLYQFLKENKLSLHDIKIIVLRIIKIVKLLHSKYNIIHRDISFENILIDTNKNISLIDFEYSFSFKQWNPPTITMGTPGFYNEKNEEIDYFTDIYSIISLLFFMENFEIYDKNKNNHDKLIDYREKASKTNTPLRYIYQNATHLSSIYSLEMLEKNLTDLII